MENLNSVWSPNWVHPNESPWSVLEKYILANIANKNDIFYLLGNDEVKSTKYKEFGDKYRNLITLDGFNRNTLHTILGFDLKEHTDTVVSLLTSKISCQCRPVTNFFYLHLRWCSQCISGGFHSLFHQSKLLSICPFHKSDLISNCPECNRQIMFKFSDQDLSGPFTCICGYTFINYRERWKEWGKPLKIACPQTIRWLEEKKDSNSIMIFNPKHISNAKDPLNLFLDANNNLSNDSIIIQSSKYIHNEIINNMNYVELSETIEPHIRHFTLEGDHHYKLYVSLYDVTRAAFLAIDRHLRSTVLKKHLTCIRRLKNVLKERESEFPPICHYAYAYVFWRQSLLGLDTFYRRERGVNRVRYITIFDAVGKPFIDDLRTLFEQYVDHCPNFAPNRPGLVGWILFRAATHYFMQYFRNWAEEASERAQDVSVPHGENLIELSRKNIPLLLFKIQLEIENKSISLYMEKRNITECSSIELVCPFNTVSLRRIKISEIDHSPLSMAIDHHETDSKHIENLKYASDYIKRLSF